MRKFGNFSLYSLNFRPNYSSQALRIWKFSAHKPPNWEIFRSQALNLEIFSSQVPPLFRGKYQFASPPLRKSGPHPLPEKVESPPGLYTNFLTNFPPISILFLTEKHLILTKLMIFTIIGQNTPIFCHLGSFILDATPPPSLYQISRKSAPKGRYIYVYHVNVRNPPSPSYNVIISHYLFSVMLCLYMIPLSFKI